ncbi:MAG: CYTH domain-containing protein [Thermoguttaceae bacterium]|nr:CYTH domain-containing protein [Thermoguttaceae bacterium]MBR0193019.1 CYTH domain-containing protein [Thermoguttaceae bacterium]
MFEVEQKFRLSDPSGFLDAARDFGVVWKKRVVEVDTYFQHPARDFVQTDEALRIRRHLTFQGLYGKEQIPERVCVESLITFKGPKLDSTAKIRKELELPLAHRMELSPERFAGFGVKPELEPESRDVQPLFDLLDTLEETRPAAQWREMLELLSFQPVQNVCKVRTKAWSLWEEEPVEFSFDEVPPLGTFAELEFLVADEAAVPGAKARLLGLSQKMGLTDVEPQSYLALVIENLRSANQN